MRRSTNKSIINFIDIYLKSEVGYIYKIESENGKIYIGLDFSVFRFTFIHLTKDG